MTNKQIWEFSCSSVKSIAPAHPEFRSEPHVLLWFTVDPKRKHGVNLSSGHVSIPRWTDRRYNRLAYGSRHGNGGATVTWQTRGRHGRPAVDDAGLVRAGRAADRLRARSPGNTKQDSTARILPTPTVVAVHRYAANIYTNLQL